MHYVFDTPRDHFLFDVSHQAYVHKLLDRPPRSIRHDSHSGGPQRIYVADGKRA